MTRTFLSEAIDAIDRIKAEPELLAQCHAAVASANRGSGETLQSLIDLGRIGQEILADPTRLGPLPTHMSGRSAIDLVEQALGAHGTTFREAMVIVETFSPETLESFLSRHSSTGHLITLAHVRVLMGEPASRRAELIEYFYQYSPKAQQLGARARKLRGPRRRGTESPPPRGLNGAVVRLRTMSRTMASNLDGHLRLLLFQPLCEWADGKRTQCPTDKKTVAELHTEVLALQSSVDSAVEVLARINQVLEGSPRRPASAPVCDMSGAFMQLTTMSETLQSQIEGPLEHILFRPLRDYVASKGELPPEFLKNLNKLGDQLASALSTMADAVEVIAAAEDVLKARQETAA